MKATKPARAKKKYYTVAEANAMLPLLRSILRDVTSLHRNQCELFERLQGAQNAKGLDAAHQEEVQQLIEEFERGQEKMRAFEFEIEKLGVELKDYYSGLIDFRHLKDGKEVYLCWRMGEPEVSHWHELNTGFTGRQKISEEIHHG